MLLGVSVVRRGASTVMAPRRWLGEKPATFQNHGGRFRGRTSTSPSLFFSPASRSPASSSRLHFSRCQEWSSTPRNKGPSFCQLHSPVGALGADGEAPFSAFTERASPSCLVCPSASLAPCSRLCIYPSLSGAFPLSRFFASKTPASPTPPPTPPAAGSSSGQRVPVPAEEKQIAHADAAAAGEELREFYPLEVEHHGDPRAHLDPDGTLKPLTTAETFHWECPLAGTPAQRFISVNGKKMILGEETRDFVELFQIYQKNKPFWPRSRMIVFGNHDLLMKAEFLFFWIPTFIIWSLAIPAFTLLYMSDEIVYSTLTVKVIGRQWYWVYEIESPVDEED